MATQPIRESRRRWWIDCHGTLWLNVRAMRRKSLTQAEWAVIYKMLDERAIRVGDNEEAVH